MNLDTHIRDIWIAVGVLSGLGIILALAQTIVWYSRAGKEIIDLGVRVSLLRSLPLIVSVLEDDGHISTQSVQHHWNHLLHCYGWCLTVVVDLLQGERSKSSAPSVRAWLF